MRETITAYFHPKSLIQLAISALLFPEIERPKKREKKGETDRQAHTDNKKQNGKRLKRRNKMMKELEE